MRELGEGQWELDGDLLMVNDRNDRTTSIIGVAEFDPGDSSARTQDAPNPMGDGALFGRDFFDAPAWTFTLSVRGATSADSLTALDRLKAAWRNEQIRRVPGATSVLRYQLKGRSRRVYGRGRKFSAPSIGQGLVEHEGGAVVPLPALAEFQLIDPYTYDDLEASLALDLVTTPGAGLSWPITFPITFGAQAGLRQGVINVAGEVSTPFRVEITGPTTGHATSPYLSGPGWTVELPGLQVAYDETVTIDMRAHTVTKNGVSVARYLSRESTLSARLMPGSQELVFGATDPTSTSSARVFWRPAHTSI